MIGPVAIRCALAQYPISAAMTHRYAHRASLDQATSWLIVCVTSPARAPSPQPHHRTALTHRRKAWALLTYDLSATRRTLSQHSAASTATPSLASTAIYAVIFVKLITSIQQLSMPHPGAESSFPVSFAFRALLLSVILYSLSPKCMTTSIARECRETMMQKARSTGTIARTGREEREGGGRTCIYRREAIRDR